MFLKKPPPGLEPGTFALQKRCSAVELGWRKVRIPLPTQNIYLPLIFRRELKHIISVKGIRFLFRIRASGKIANGGGAFRRNRSFRRTRVLQIQRRRHKRISGVPWVWRGMPVPRPAPPPSPRPRVGVAAPPPPAAPFFFTKKRVG